MSKNENTIETEVKLTTAELKAAYAALKEEAKLAHALAKEEDATLGKFTFQSLADYKNDYNIKWELAHPNDKDALPSTDAVLSIVDTAIDAVANVKAEAGTSKMALARAIFAEELKAKGPTGLVRKDILKRFFDEAGCTLTGANTYYNTCRSENGLVKSK